ncbi:MAG: SLC13 family permease [Verrucomicrobia bacterium]|nr:SLC13 family permease [Verrucomicrobiota bacterium]
MEPWPILSVLVIVGATIWFFAAEKFPVDLVAVMVLAALVLCRLVTPVEGVSGFANPATITVAAMFVLSAGLAKTGAVSSVGRALAVIGVNRWILLPVMMVVVAALSAFINNTACVAILLPVVLALAVQKKIAPSKLLIPLSFASQFGGVCTLIGSSPNILVSSMAAQAGLEPFSMFEMGRFGLILCGAGVLYFLVAGQFLLPTAGDATLTETYQLGGYVTELRVMEQSPLIGRTVTEARVGERAGLIVLEVLRGAEKIIAPHDELLQAGDVLLVRGDMQRVMAFKTAQKLEIAPEFKLADETLRARDLHLTEVVIAPNSRMAGQTLVELDFRRQFSAIVLAIHRHGEALRDKLNAVRLQAGDVLLLISAREQAPRFRGNPNFLVLDRVEEPSLRRRKAPVALLILATVVALAALNLMPIVVAALLGCMALVLTRCLTLDEAYAAVDWKVIVVLAGVLPLGLAMEKTGTAQLLADQALWAVGWLGPIGALTVVYLVTLLLSEIMSNTATAAMMVPIGISTALALDVSPRPFLMAIAFAAATCFATPVGYQTNLMVYTPGGYKFRDYLRVGIPLDILLTALALYFIPKFWPF